MLRRGRTPWDDSTTAVEFNRFFDNKVATVRLTADAQPSFNTIVHSRCAWVSTVNIQGVNDQRRP